MLKLCHTVLLWLCVAGLAHASDEGRIAGVWKGEMDGTPAADVEVREAASGLSGTATFYMVVDKGDGPKVEGKTEAPLVAPAFDGQRLRFGIRRESDGTLLRFELIVTARDRGELRSASSGELSVPMRRVK